MHVTFVGYSWNIQGIFQHSVFPEHSPGNIRIFNIPGICLREYSPEFHRECFPNIPGIHHGNVPRIFQENIFCLVGSDIENFDPNSIKVDEKSYINILIYYIGYVTKKICSVNPLYLIFST